MSGAEVELADSEEEREQVRAISQSTFRCHSTVETSVNPVGNAQRDIIIISSSDTEDIQPSAIIKTHSKRLGPSTSRHFLTAPTSKSTSAHQLAPAGLPSRATSAPTALPQIRSFWDDEVDEVTVHPVAGRSTDIMQVDPSAPTSSAPLPRSPTDSNSSSNTSSSKRKSDIIDSTSAIIEKQRPKKRSTKKTSQFQTAAQLLATELPRVAMIVSAIPPPIGITMSNEANATHDNILDGSMGSGSDLTASSSASACFQEAALGPALDPQDFTRAKLGLPLLDRTVSKGKGKRVVVREALEITIVNQGEGKAEVEEGHTKNESSRMRLAHFLYDGKEGSAIPPTRGVEPTTTSRTPSSRAKAPPTAYKMDLPPPARLGLLEACPLCHEEWLTTKTPTTKATHLRLCAVEEDLTVETVWILIEKYILALAEEVENDRRALEGSFSLLDRAIGIGQGIGVHKEVNVVGVAMAGDTGQSGDEGELLTGWGQRDPLRLAAVQQEIDEKRKRRKVEKVVTAAKEIKLGQKYDRERKENQVKREREAKATQERGVTQIALPRLTGMLQGDSTASRKATANRGGALLLSLAGSGLTQQVIDDDKTTTARYNRIPAFLANLSTAASTLASTSKATINSPSKSTSTLSKLDTMEPEESLFLPAPTQEFPPSKLAARLAKSGQTEITILSTPMYQRQLSHETDSDSDEDTDEMQDRSNSLWHAAGGDNDELLHRVVVSSLSISLSPTLRDLSSITSYNSASLPLLFEIGITVLIKRKVKPNTNSFQSISSSPSPSPPPHSPSPFSSPLVPPLSFRNVPTPQSTDNRSNDFLAKAAVRPLLPLTCEWKGETGGQVQEMMEGEEEEMSMLGSDLENGEGVLTWEGISTMSDQEDDLPIKQARREKEGSKGRKEKAKEKEREREGEEEEAEEEGGRARAPDYSTFTLAVLQSEVARYGYKVSKSRAVLVDQLNAVWIALEEQKKVEEPTKRKGKKGVAVKGNGKAKKRGKKGEDVDKDKDEESEEEEVETVGERLRKLILVDEVLYSKVLRYEPVFFDDIVNLAAANKVKTSKPVIMRCLDEQSITFYSQDPTGGPRRRF